MSLNRKKILIILLILAFDESSAAIVQVCQKTYISMGRNFNNILKYNVLSSNFGGYFKLLRVN